ncbi:HAD family hydrolase [Actinoplanes sp. NEAU-A12]|uniref:HAD family hydrolase n=1 Tax=Actinoplanes sandaracinus TaxID=3045177 RepID=A0ABT6WZ17_9ACTN|nr:HAD family hydrolase [Actinoplanes sandaracinus]MDI6104856.1 HAD family hydrolase [Actinoplanes sandaracinus]
MRAVLFDLDDTLVDQETAAGAAVVSWAATLGITGPGVAADWARIAEPHYARYQRREITFTGQRRERVREFLAASPARHPGAVLTDEEADGLFAGYLERYESGWAAFDDAVPALRHARATGLTVAVLTNGDEAQQRRKLDRTGLAAEIDVLVASSALPAGKPDPRAFRAAVDLLGVDASEALMVGDSLDKDIRGALAAGLPAVLLDRHGVHAGAGVPTVRTLLDLAPHLGRA